MMTEDDTVCAVLASLGHSPAVQARGLPREDETMCVTNEEKMVCVTNAPEDQPCAQVQTHANVAANDQNQSSVAWDEVVNYVAMPAQQPQFRGALKGYGAEEEGSFPDSVLPVQNEGHTSTAESVDQGIVLGNNDIQFLLNEFMEAPPLTDALDIAGVWDGQHDTAEVVQDVTNLAGEISSMITEFTSQGTRLAALKGTPQAFEDCTALMKDARMQEEERVAQAKRKTKRKGGDGTTATGKRSSADDLNGRKKKRKAMLEQVKKTTMQCRYNGDRAHTQIMGSFSETLVLKVPGGERTCAFDIVTECSALIANNKFGPPCNINFRKIGTGRKIDVSVNGDTGSDHVKIVATVTPTDNPCSSLFGVCEDAKSITGKFSFHWEHVLDTRGKTSAKTSFFLAHLSEAQVKRSAKWDARLEVLKKDEIDAAALSKIVPRGKGVHRDTSRATHVLQVFIVRSNRNGDEVGKRLMFLEREIIEMGHKHATSKVGMTTMALPPYSTKQSVMVPSSALF